MSHIGSGVEQALHCLLYLTGDADGRPSARDLAEFQGVSQSYVAKLFTTLEKAGIVAASGGVQGGYRLARPAEAISVLEIVDAVEGRKPLFRCRDIRRNCVLYGDDPPPWSTEGVCGIHAVMLEAEARMRDSLASVSVQDIADRTARKVPAEARAAASRWFGARRAQRGVAREVSDV